MSCSASFGVEVNGEFKTRWRQARLYSPKADYVLPKLNFHLEKRLSRWCFVIADYPSQPNEIVRTSKSRLGQEVRIGDIVRHCDAASLRGNHFEFKQFKIHG